MPKKEMIASWCLLAGTILGGFSRLYVIAAMFFLIALAIDIPILVEEYRKWKHKKERKNGSGKVE